MQIIKRIFGYLLLFGYSLSLVAQTQKSAPSGSEEVFAHLLGEAKQFKQKRRYDSCRHRLLIANKMLGEIEDPGLLADFYLHYGNYYHYGLQRFDSSLVYYYESLKHANQVPSAKQRLKAMERLAYAHYTWTEHEAAINWCTQCIELADSLGDVPIQARCMQLLGTLSVTYNKDTAQLIAFRRKALDLCLSACDSASLPRAYHYMALSFFQIGNHYSALAYNDSAFYWASNQRNDRIQTESLFWQGLSLQAIGQYRKALDKLNAVLPYYESGRDTFRVIHTKHEMAKILLAQKEYAGVLSILDEISPAVQSKNALFEWSVQYDLYYQTYQQLGNYPKALHYLECFSAVKDSVAQKDNIRAIAGIEARHEVRNKQKTIDNQQSELKLRKQLELVYILGLLLAALLLGGLLFLYFRIRKAQREVSKQRDIVRKQNQDLEQLDTLKSRFFANVSHELRTPLTLILGPLSSMINSKSLTKENSKLAHLAQQHGQSLLQMVNEILDLSKMESGKLEVHEVEVSLQPFLLQIVEAFQTHAASRGIKIKVAYRVEKRLQLLIDAEKLTTILNNLLANALKFTPAHMDKRIELSAQDLGDYIRLAVRDNGHGIHPEDLPHIFERYYQSTHVDTPVEGGTGIGLAICREYAELLKGSLQVESSTTAGISGSVFYLDIPRQKVDRPKIIAEDVKSSSGLAPLSENIPSGSITKTATTILVVEDNADMREYLRTILSKKYQVETAETGQEALDVLATHYPDPDSQQAITKAENARIDLIISDIMMPVIDGFQLVQTLKKSTLFCRIPVIMLTARADLQDRLRALRIGVDDYLLKPFEEQELLARSENLLRFAKQRNTENPSADTTHFKPAQGSAELEWLSTLERAIEKHLKDARFSTSFLAELMAMSPRQLQRKLKDNTGLSTNQYIQEIRLQFGRRLLETGNYLIKEVAAEVGFKDPNYFSSLYRERFGKLDSE